MKELLPNMFNYIKIHTKLFPILIGITNTQFDKLFPLFTKELEKQSRERYMKENDRKRSPGGGRPSKLKTPEEKLFFILFYYRHYPTYRMAEILFELDHTNVQRWVQFLEGVLNKSLAYELKLPKTQIHCLNQLINVCPELKHVLVDATERPIRRPKDPETENNHYSGKKKCHTVKNQIAVSPYNKRILHVSNTYIGKTHDKKIFDETTSLWIHAPPNTVMLVDGGYQAIEENSPYIKVLRPYKRKPKEDLTKAQKETNKVLSGIRVMVEHPFAHMKNFKILEYKFRNRLNRAHKPFETIACIYNFKLGTA